MDETFNPDILEILLSETYQMAHVLNGLLTSKLRYITETHYGGESYYNMTTIFRQGSLHALDPELLKPFYSKLYIPNNELNHEWQDAITNALINVPINIPTSIRNEALRGVNWEVVKYSHIDFNLFNYYNNLYHKLYIQTNGFDPVELGKRVVLVPGEVPKSFDDLIKTYEPLTREFKIIKNFLEMRYSLDGPINDVQTMNDTIRLYISPDIEGTKRGIVKDLEVFNTGEIDESELTMAMLEQYREKYETCIIVKPEYTRLYTRARFISNILINKNLNESLINYIVTTESRGLEDTSLRAYEFLGLSARHILKDHHHLYIDKEGFPIFSNLYLFGSIEDRLFPESINYTDCQKLCYCEWCNPFLFNAQLYESNTGEVYIMVNFHAKLEDFFKDLINKKCYYHLFLNDIPFHYQRLASLEEWRAVKKPSLCDDININLGYVVKNYGSYHPNWFSTSYRIIRSMYNAEDIIRRTQDGY